MVASSVYNIPQIRAPQQLEIVPFVSRNSIFEYLQYVDSHVSPL